MRAERLRGLSLAEQWRVLRRALPQMVQSAPLLVGGMLLVALLQGLVPALVVLIGKWTVDGVTAVAQGEEANLTLLALAWAGAALLSQLTGVARALLQGLVADHFTVATISSLMDKMSELHGLEVLESPRFHDDIELLQVGAPRRPLNLTSVLLGMVSNVVAAVSLALTLLSVGWWVPLVAVAGMLPLIRKQMELYSLGWSMTVQRTEQSREINYQQRVAMRHEYAKEVRLYGMMPALRARYLADARDYQRIMRGVRQRQLLEVLPQQVLMLAVTAGIFAYVVAQAGAGLQTAGAVVLVITALAQLRERLGSVSDVTASAGEHLGWFAKYHAFLDAVPAVSAPPQPAPLPERFDLCLEAVSFGYAGHAPVLEDLSLCIPEGQTVAVVGENGAGKSTLIKLLLRFYDPTAGRITVGGTDLRDLDPVQWRSQVAAVFQDYARFEWSVRDNVLLGSPEDPQRLAQAAQGSGLSGLLPRLESGMDTRIGQAFGGIDLSGGQWQKLVTARALYRPARVLILDEPTAALDPRSEAEVFAGFAAISRGRTTLLVTHRLGSVRMADRILVLKAGRLIEDGSHEQLLARGGEYAELWRLQAQQYAESETDQPRTGLSGDRA